jgi:hypothetical protein
MIPSRSKPRYKICVRFKSNAWYIVRHKKFRKQKWQATKLLTVTKIPLVVSSYKYELSRFPENFRFMFKHDLLSRLQIRWIYGRLQQYRIKQIALKSKKKSWFSYIQSFEQTPTSFLYRLNLISTYSEIVEHQKNNYIYISGNSKKRYLKKGDVLHFCPYFKNILKRRLVLNYLKYKIKKETKRRLLSVPKIKIKKIPYKILQKYFKSFKFSILFSFNSFYIGIQTCVDFEPNSFRFLFLNDIKHYKNSPFRIPFRHIYRWYTKV